MLERDAASTTPLADDTLMPPRAAEPAAMPSGSDARLQIDLARHRAETERLRVLVDFLARPVHAHGGTEPDPDVVTAYNLAVEAVLAGIRRAASAS